jgi:hypothetical protein
VEVDCLASYLYSHQLKFDLGELGYMGSCPAR